MKGAGGWWGLPFWVIAEGLTLHGADPFLSVEQTLVPAPNPSCANMRGALLYTPVILDIFHKIFETKSWVQKLREWDYDCNHSNWWWPRIWMRTKNKWGIRRSYEKRVKRRREKNENKVIGHDFPGPGAARLIGKLSADDFGQQRQGKLRGRTNSVGQDNFL